MNLFGFFRRQKRIQVIRREETKITLAEWRADYDLVKLARSVWINPDFRLMMACLRNENPAFGVLPDDAPPTRSIALQRRAEGYIMALSNLEAMATLEQKTESLEPTFEEEENPSPSIR